MHHHHTILRQRDSLSEEVSSQNSMKSENHKFLASRNSSTRSTTFESSPNNTNNTLSQSIIRNTSYNQPPNDKRIHPMDNDNTHRHHINGKESKLKPKSDHTTLSPIGSDTEKPPKAIDAYSTLPTHSPESPQSVIDVLTPRLDEKDDELSDLPSKQPSFLQPNMRVDSNSNLSNTPSISKHSAYSYQSTVDVDSSSVFKPSEYKTLSAKDKTPKAQQVSDLLAQAHNESKQEAPHTKALKDNKNTHRPSIQRTKRRQKKKQKQKLSKCGQCYKDRSDKYKKCNETHMCCIKFRSVQFLGRKYITTTAIFKWAILLCILTNCIFIALEDPTGDENSAINSLVKKSEVVFALIFTLEMAIKMLCNGLFGHHMTDQENEKTQQDVDIEKERQHNEENEKQLADREASANPINEGIECTEHETEHKIDPIQAIELADFHDLNIPIDLHAEDSTSSTDSGDSSVSSEQRNDLDPKYYVGYFRDGWNILDFIIVITSWVEWLPIDGGSNLTAIRVLRVLRPLRTFTKIKSLKVLIATIIKSLRGLSDVLVLLLFLFVVFAIIGIQMFSGRLHQQCFSEDFRTKADSDWCCDDPTKWVEDENFCVLNKGETGNNNINNGCPSELPWCLNIAPNPNGGVTNFDNIIYAMLNVFVTISLEGWAAIQYKLEDTGASLAWIYFVLLTFIVGFFAANLCLAVIENVYGDEMEKKRKKEQKDGDDKILEQATKEANAVWKRQKTAKLMIVEPDDDDIVPRTSVLPPISPEDVGGAIQDGVDPDEDDSTFKRVDSYRMQHLGPDGESEFRIHMVMQLPPSPRVNQIPHLSHIHERCRSADVSNPIKSSPDKIPFSSQQAGLIHTSQEWNDLQLTQMDIETETKTKKKVNHHKRTSSFKLKKSKNVRFQHPLGPGTQSFMHRYRTGQLHQSCTSLHTNTKSNARSDKYRFDEEYTVTDLDHTDTDHIFDITPRVSATPRMSDTIPRLASGDRLRTRMSGEDRKAKFAKSRTSKTQRSLSQRSKTRMDVLKVDYKTTTTENFESAMNRVKLYVNKSKQKEFENDVREYTMFKATDSVFDASHGDLVDDLTFGDMPLSFTEHQEKEKQFMTKELRRKGKRAEKKRKRNEILARKAIIIAHMEPLWTEWVEARTAPWIDWINTLVVSKLFETFIMIVIIANTVVLALTWPQQNDRLKDILETVNTMFTFLFILEAVLKIIGLGPRAYIDDNWNKFDFAIVFVSVCEMLIGLVWSLGSGGSAISALRSMRLLRTFRLLGKFDKLKRLFMLVVASMHEVGLLTMVLAIFIFMFAALAMSLFGGKLIRLGDRRSGRWRFDNFYWSWVNVFMVISGDSWNEVMYDTVKATGDRSTTIYYVIVVCFGTFVILNLFVAILLSRMSSTESEEDFMLDGLTKYSTKMWIHEVEKQDQVDRLVMRIERKKYIAQFKDKRSKWKHHRDKDKMEGKSLGIFDSKNKFRYWCHRIVTWTWFEISIDVLILINCVFLAWESPKAREKSGQMFWWADILFTILFVLEFIIKVVALGAFQQPFRKRRTWTSISDDDKLNEWTDKSYQVVFFMHTLDHKGVLDLPGLAIEYIESSDGWGIVHFWGQQVLRIVYDKGSFATCYKLVDNEEGKWELWHKNVNTIVDAELETVLTSFDLTDHHHNAYFASNWNRLDALVVLVAVLGVGFENVSFLRALRAFRPFRIMVRFKKIKVVLGALLRAIPGLMNTFLFCILFWFVLSILGVNWLNGLYRHCRIHSFDEYTNICSDLNSDIATDPLCDLCTDQCVMYNLNEEQCDLYSAYGLVWTISVFNFDNVFEALHCLFVVSTLSGWNFVMYEAIDSTSYGAALREDNRPYFAIYFMVVIVLCSFFSLNLIVSIVVDNFNKIKAEKEGSAFQTEEQTLWVNNKRLLERISLNPMFATPNNCVLRWCFKIVEHKWFDPFIMLCIILNAVSMALEHYNQTDTWSMALRIADIVFVVIFCAEAILKIASYGFTLYILSNWNKFDFVISIVGLVQLLTDSGLGLNVLRLFRVGRLLRLLHKAKTLKMLFWTLVYSIPSLWNIGLLLFVIFFIYAVVAMHVLTDYKTEIYDEVNAETFWNAVSLLYRVGTEDGWTDVYQAYLERWPRGERYKIYIYFVSFFVLGTLVLINLFIAVVLDSFQENNQSFSREEKFEIIQTWRDIWSYFDQNATRDIPARDFIDILRLTPKSDKFAKKHKIIGPGFFDGRPFEELVKKIEEDQSFSRRGSTSFSRASLMQLNPWSKDNKEHHSNNDYMRKINAMYDVETRKKRLRKLCATTEHSDMIKLLLRYRLKVRQHEDNEAELTCFGKLAKLIYEICNSMGIGTRADKDILIKQHTMKKDLTQTHRDTLNTLTEKDRKELQTELRDNVGLDIINSNAIHHLDFDVAHKTWYVSYDDALLAICSEVIGPRLPDGFPMFQISTPEDEDEPQTELRIAEWYTIKHDCYDVFKAVTLAIEQKKQYADTVPSQHVSNERQRELQQKTRASMVFKMEFKKLKNQIATNKLKDQVNITVNHDINNNIIEEIKREEDAEEEQQKAMSDNNNKNDNDS